MFGALNATIHHSSTGWSPVYITQNLSIISTSFLLPDHDAAVVWRGPRKNGLIRQFVTDVDWGELDYLLVDTPPGTSDEHISIIQYLREGDANVNSAADKPNGISGAIVVTTPEEMSMADVRKELNFCQKTNCPILGVVENMGSLESDVSSFTFNNGETDITSEVHSMLDVKYGKEVAEKITASCDVFPPPSKISGPMKMCQDYKIPHLGSLPLDPLLLKCCENGVSYMETVKGLSGGVVGSKAGKVLNTFVDGVVELCPPSTIV